VFDFTNLPRLSTDMIVVYQKLEEAIHTLKQRMTALKLDDDKAADGLVEPLLNFWCAMQDVQSALGENGLVRLSDTLDQLRWAFAGAAESAALLLGAASKTQFPHMSDDDFHKRAHQAVRGWMNSVKWSPNPDGTWRHINMRIAEYTDALLKALNPYAPAANPARHLQRPRWDGMRLWHGQVELRSYQKRFAPNQAAILDALEVAQWPEHPVRLPESCWPSLHITLKRINEGIKDSLIQLQAGGDGQSVLWSNNS
jgi:hypothetical protein